MMNCRTLLIFTALLAGCTAFSAPKVDDTHLYLLDARPATVAESKKSTRILSVSQPVSRPGYDTPQMAYQRLPLELQYFATHQWADTPAHMLQPLIMQALAPNFSAVVPASGIIPANLRLDTELIRLQQDFTSKPGKTVLTLRAQLIDLKDKRVIAEKLFDEVENTESDDAYGGVVAANRALQRVLAQLAEFCLDASTGS